jgi:hypothetical protein
MGGDRNLVTARFAYHRYRIIVLYNKTAAFQSVEQGSCSHLVWNFLYQWHRKSHLLELLISNFRHVYLIRECRFEILFPIP